MEQQEITHLHKVTALAEANWKIKNLFRAYNGYEHMTPKFKGLVDALVKEEETKAVKENRKPIWEPKEEELIKPVENGE